MTQVPFWTSYFLSLLETRLERRSKSKNTDLIEVVDKTINDETLNDKRKRSIASSSDDSSDDEKNQKETSSQLPLLERSNTGPFHLSLSTPTLQKNTLISTPTSTSIPKSLFSSIQCKNTTKNNLNSLRSNDKFEENDASDSRILTKILEVVMQNQKDLKFLSTKVMGLESDNKNFHNELSEIKDAIGSSDESLKAVSSNKKTHGWIDVYISYIAEDLILDYKYPTKEQVKEASLRILTKFQSEKIKLIMASNEWDLLFENGILSALTSLRGGIVSKIKQKMFEVFGHSLEHIDSDASSRAITSWKESDNTKWCFENLGTIMPDESNTTYMDEIIKRSFQTKTATKNDRLFAIAVVCYILDENSRWNQNRKEVHFKTNELTSEWYYAERLGIRLQLFYPSRCVENYYIRTYREIYSSAS
ncbi:115_t:CDS:2 [Rhizophagus irregularis]|nr:115_t:CDS:2 [Rhizophagus irregularis]